MEIVLRLSLKNRFSTYRSRGRHAVRCYHGGQALVLTPVKDANRQTAFKAALDKVNQKYAKALKKLAE
jgi:hypothetical protein